MTEGSSSSANPPTNRIADLGDSELLALRRRVLAPTYRLFYEEPVHIVRAEGVWMYDANGRAYLDAYNNVVVVGHCHPHVVDAIARQAGKLNTHTRYLTNEPLELADRLLATFPKEISNVTLTCTGSDANDLAVRITKAATGGTGFIVTDFAYHGTTETTSGMSPGGGVELGPHVYTVQPPLGPDGAAQFATRVRECIQKMRADGVRPAGLLVDTIFSSDGVCSHPPGFLAAAVGEIRAAGGLFIADEVQPGFGRTGDHMWGFQRHGVIPDLVTMGKPMGNGHPVAAVVARPEAIAQFAKRYRYFNTFGGNPVACAAAIAVLDVLESEHLLENARDTGSYLRQRIHALTADYESIREVRGAGLFLGVQIGPSSARNLDASKEAARIVNGMRREGVLIGYAARKADVLKVRPPLPFQRAQADFFVEKLEKVLRAS